MSFSRLLHPSSIALLGVMLMASSTFIYYFYSKASSSNSSEPKNEESSSNSSEPEIEVSSSNSCAPKKEESSSNSSEPTKEESSSNSSEQESSSNSSAPEKEESSSNSSEPTKEESSSNSSTSTSFKYDVFLSFRGADTRNNFLSHLYEALTAKGIATYKDDERIHKGNAISDELIKAIQDSRFYIIVFSKNYASSSWCLEELAKIMECRKMTGRTAYPVFYDVEPTQVRNQSGVVENAFSKNKEKEAAEKWKGALKEAGGLAGWALNDGDESKFIKEIVGVISLELRSISFGSDEKLVGMETRVKDIVDSLKMEIDDVCMIGIKGMGGVGKTTTALAVFNRLSNDFEAKIFVRNVREVSKPSMSGLKKLQKQVLSDVMKEDVTVNDVTHGINMMQERMRGTKVLLVLDDVDHIEQLEALAGGSNWFKPGSRIIVTTRDEQILQAHRVNFRDIDKVDHRVKIRDINLLSDEEAIFLLSRHAFGRAIPSQGYEELSVKVVRYAAGLPLTLKVLGSSLCGKNEDEWKDAIKRLEKFPLPEEIQKKLELSYESLEKDYKEMFLDIACILKGLCREDAIRILECCGFNPRIGLGVLEQRCLITFSSYYECLGMHDHIEEMGKNIVRREHPNPNKHSRLWIQEEIEDILVDDEGTEATICLELRETNTNAKIVMKGLGKMKKLRYLQVHFPYQDYFFRDAKDLDNTAQYFSNSLKYLKCCCYPFLYLPKTFQASNLVGLEMKLSKMVQLWEEGENKVLKKLKFLSLYKSNLTAFDFQITPNLETLYLNDCADFEELHVSSACPNLKFLELCNSRLRSLDLELFPNLERLDLQGCDKLVKINAPIGCLKKVGYINLNRCLRFSHFEVSFGGLEPQDSRSSASLRLVGMSRYLCRLHPNSNLLKSQFEFDCWYEENLPSSVGNIEKLISFGLCDFKKFSYMICSLRCLRKLELECDIPEFPKDLGKLECLEELSLSSTKIKHLPDSICMLKCLKSLKVCNDLLEKLPENLGQLECLEELYVKSEKIKHLPDSICMLKCLKSLKVYNDLLEKLPENLGQLECLEELYVTSEKIEYLPDSICMLKRLKSLDVKDCSCLGKLPENIGQLESLESLYLSATKIKHLPDSICMLKRLKSLDVENCSCLGKLPENIGQLESLESIYLSATKIKHLPDSICILKRRKSLDFLDYCCDEKFLEDLRLFGSLNDLDDWKLPDDLGRLEYVGCTNSIPHR